MPYASVSALPPAAKQLPPKKQKQFMEVFNSIHAKTKDEKQAFAGAWSAVGGAPMAKEAIFKGPSQASKQTMYCVVLEPDSEDLQEDVITSDEIEKSAHDYLLNARVVGNSHDKKKDGSLVVADAGIVESFIAPVDFSVGSETIRKGSWVVAIKVFDSELWSAVEKGEVTGVSIGGFGERAVVE